MVVREIEKRDIWEKNRKPFKLETLLVCSTVARWRRRTSDTRISLSWEEHGRKESVGVGIMTI
jgi:hypothetical protein